MDLLSPYSSPSSPNSSSCASLCSQVSSYKTLHIYSPKANYQPPVSCDYLSFFLNDINHMLFPFFSSFCFSPFLSMHQCCKVKRLEGVALFFFLRRRAIDRVISRKRGEACRENVGGKCKRGKRGIEMVIASEGDV